MSNLDTTATLTRCGGLSEVAARPVHELFAGREVKLGESTVVRRLLPNLGRRLVGPWCFVDHYGPDDITDQGGMAVAPHPHIGLQTVSWLLDGEVQHRDSIGSKQLLKPGTLGLMTSGRGIAHAEYSPAAAPPMPGAPSSSASEPRSLLHGVQLWVALPQASRAVTPTWDFHGTLPMLGAGSLTATVIMGELAGARSPGRAYSPMVGADLALVPGGSGSLPLEPDFEYALLVMSGSVEVENADVQVGSMLYLGCGRNALTLESEPGARVLLLGGEPFDEQIVMWWNFVARSNDEIIRAREQWMSGTEFGAVADCDAAPLAAPALTGQLKPGGSARR